MENLKYLYLDNNQLSGEIPQSIGNLEILRRLYLHNNYLSGQIPESICNIYDSNIDFWMYLSNNRLCPISEDLYLDCSSVLDSAVPFLSDQIGVQSSQAVCD